jgi:tight adherence protein C
MTHDQLVVLLTVGGGVLLLLAAAFILLFHGASEQEIARRVSKLREGATVAKPQSTSRFLPSVIALMRRLGNGMRDRMLSAKDAEALAKTLAASGLEPSKAMPIFIGAKLACLFALPTLTWLGTVLLGYSTGKQALYTAVSVGVAMMLPNWVMGLIRRPYQAALRRGIPDALDLMVVCAEAGLGLESAVERVAQEMKQSNRPVGVEFSLLMHEMRVYPDRRIALSNLAERTGQNALKRLAATVMQTLKYGTPLSQGLRTLAAEMRNERMIQFEERAGKLPALLVMPMMLFILPCLFIIIMGKPASQLMGVFATMHH